MLDIILVCSAVLATGVSLVALIRTIGREKKKDSKESVAEAEKVLNDKIDGKIKPLILNFETNHLEHFRSEINDKFSKVQSGIEGLKIDVGVLKERLKEVDSIKGDIRSMKDDLGLAMQDHATFTDNQKVWYSKVDAALAKVDEIRGYCHIHSKELSNHGARLDMLDKLLEKSIRLVSTAVASNGNNKT